MSAAGVKYWVKIKLQGIEYVVRLGDTVWFYIGCNMDTTPQCGTITQISEDHMVDLAIINPDVNRKISQKGVCLFGSETLMSNKVHQNKGCWLPQTPVEVIRQFPTNEG
jgi:hypothetical protein